MLSSVSRKLKIVVLLLNYCNNFIILREPLKTGLKRENGYSAPNARKADEVRLDALRGGLTKQAVCYTHFPSNEFFRGDLKILVSSIT